MLPAQYYGTVNDRWRQQVIAAELILVYRGPDKGHYRGDAECWERFYDRIEALPEDTLMRRFQLARILEFLDED